MITQQLSSSTSCEPAVHQVQRALSGGAPLFQKTTDGCVPQENPTEATHYVKDTDPPTLALVDRCSEPTFAQGTGGELLSLGERYATSRAVTYPGTRAKALIPPLLALDWRFRSATHGPLAASPEAGCRGGTKGAKTGAVTVVQRCSSDVRLNPHLHVVLDGAYHERESELVFEGFGHLKTREVGEVLE